MVKSYYNEIDPAAAHILRALIDADVIAPGDVDTRSIKDVQPDDLSGYTQCHFFAGGGLWSVAARLAGWPDDRPLWTGSCPCQPFSAAGKGLGTDDPRHLWPDFHRLIRAGRPAVVMGEQVAGKAGRGWFDGVSTDLEGDGFAARAVDFPACSVDAPHQRNRLYWIATNGRVADHDRIGPAAHGRDAGEVGGLSEAECRAEHNAALPWRVNDPAVGHISGARPTVTQGDGCRPGFQGGSIAEVGQGNLREEGQAASSPDAGNGSFASDANGHRCDGARLPARSARELLPDGARHPQRNGTYWSDADWIECHDGKARRAQSGIRFLVDGLPGRVDLWRVGGNAIVPQAAAEVIAAFMDVYGVPRRAA